MPRGQACLHRLDELVVESQRVAAAMQGATQLAAKVPCSGQTLEEPKDMARYMIHHPAAGKMRDYVGP